MNDHIANLENIDKQITHLIQVDEKNAKDIGDLARKLNVVAESPIKDPKGDQDMQELTKQL